MHRFLQHHAADVTGVLSGFDRVRFRGTYRRIANAGGLTSLLHYRGVRMKDFKPFAEDVTTQVRRAVEQVATTAGRPVEYLASWTLDKEAHARAIAARDHVETGLICILSCQEQCQSFELRSDKARGVLVCAPATRRCLHYYAYYQHARFGFLHVRLQSWLPLNQWVCLNGREWLAQELTRAGLGFTRVRNAIRPADLAAAQALLDAQVTHDWTAALTGLAEALVPPTVPFGAAFPLHYYWSIVESEWATDVLFRSPAALGALYPALVRHGITALGCAEVLRYLGKRVNQDGTIPRRFRGEVLSDLRPAHVASPTPPRRGAEAVRLKHRVNRNWVKLYDKTPDTLRAETVINHAPDLRVYRRREGEGPAARKRWAPLRKGVVDLPRRAALSQQANARYLDALAAVDAPTPLGDLAAGVCQPVRRWHGRRARGLNPLSEADAALLAAVSRGEFAITGLRNRDLRACLFGATRDPVQRRRQSGQVTRRLRLLRAHGLLKKLPRTNRYQVTPRGRVLLTALLTARAANTRRLLEAA